MTVDGISLPRIDFNHLRKEYDGRAVVDDLELTIQGGTIHCLLGPNGAGKTTSMHMLMGLRQPTAGEIRIDRILTTLPAIHRVRRHMGFVADQPSLYDDLTGREFLQFLAEMYECPQRVDDLSATAQQFDLVYYLDRRLVTCSLGTRKKVAILAALITDPVMLVLDEPTGALDAHAARATKDLMQQFRDDGRLVLFSTHMMEMAQQIADVISIMTDGKLIFSGSLDEMRERHGRSAGESLENIFLRLTSHGASHEESQPLAVPV